VAVLNAGVFNSGLLATDRPNPASRYEYTPAPPSLMRRAEAIAAICTRHGTTLPAAAVAFAAAHPAVTTVVLGAQTPAQVRRNAALAPPPPALWADLVAAGLLRADAPTPS
jgi:D-threo-aldose 1-dehydrogenase